MASCTVTVTQPVTGISLNKSTATLTVGSTEQLTATIAPANATNKNVSWTSSNPSVATVNANGKVTAIAAGTTTITVKTGDGNKTATCVVTVNVPTITLDFNEITGNIGEGWGLTAYVDNVNTIYTSLVQWSNSNTNIVEIEGAPEVISHPVTGKIGIVIILKIKSAGECTITATIAGTSISASCRVIVSDTPVALTGFSLNNGDGIAVFRTVDLTYTLSGGAPTHFMASEKQDFSGASWKAYDPSALNYTFASDEAGTKTVYTKLKNSRGETEVRSDDIYYKPYHPVNLASFTPNNGQKSAAMRTISLNHVIGDGTPTLYSISENLPDVGKTWLPYSPLPIYTLSAGNGMKELFFVVSDGTSVSNTLSAKILLDEATIRLYPNPVKDILNIEFTSNNPTPEIRVQVYTLAGTMLLEKDSGTPVFSIDLSSCPAGVLLVKVSDGTKTEIHRIIKQ
jgi:hypothetical protein